MHYSLGEVQLELVWRVKSRTVFLSATGLFKSNMPETCLLTPWSVYTTKCLFVCFSHIFFENQQRHQHRWNMITKARFYLYLHQRACVCCSWQWGVTFMADMLQHGPRSGGGHSWHIPLSSHTYFTTGEFNTACIYILYVCRVIHRCVILPHPSSTSTTFLYTSMKGILRHLLWVTHIVG